MENCQTDTKHSSAGSSLTWRGGRLGRPGAGCVLRLLLQPQLQALGPVSPQNFTVGQHFLHQDLSEAWVGHGREV